MIRNRRPAASAHRSIRPVGGLLAALVGVLLGACGLVADPPDSLGGDRPQATSEPTPTATATDANVADPVTVEAPAAAIDTSLVPVGLQGNGAMELPDPGTGAWYELGPRPGEPGPAVLIGHVDSVAGPDVFYELSSLVAGDQIHVDDRSGVRRTFVVTGIELVPKDDLPYDRIWADVDEPVLRLITCGGDYDPADGGYQGNVVVYAEMTEPAQAS